MTPSFKRELRRRLRAISRERCKTTYLCLFRNSSKKASGKRSRSLPKELIFATCADQSAGCTRDKGSVGEPKWLDDPRGANNRQFCA